MKDEGNSISDDKKKWFYFLKFHYLDIYSFYMLSEVEGLYNHGQGRHVGSISSFKKKTVVVMRYC